MSVELSRAVWARADLSSGPKLVLLALADRANGTGRCWPSRADLAQMTGLSASRVSVHLAELIEAGLIERTRRHQQSALYTLSRDRLRAPEDVSDQAPSIAEQDVSKQDVLKQDVSFEDVLKQEPDVAKQDISSLYVLTINEPSSSEVPPTAENEQTSNADLTLAPEGEFPLARQLCELLAERMVANGCKPPSVGKRWLDAARLLLDRDGRNFAEACAVLAWSQSSEFWRANIHSMPKFREKYDQLRLQAQQAGALNGPLPTPGSTAQDAAVEWLRECWCRADIRPIEERTGLRYHAADLPFGVSDGAQFFREDRQKWITGHRVEILSRVSGRSPAESGSEVDDGTRPELRVVAGGGQ